MKLKYIQQYTILASKLEINSTSKERKWSEEVNVLKIDKQGDPNMVWGVGKNEKLVNVGCLFDTLE